MNSLVNTGLFAGSTPVLKVDVPVSDFTGVKLENRFAPNVSRHIDRLKEPQLGDYTNLHNVNEITFVGKSTNPDGILIANEM